MSVTELNVMSSFFELVRDAQSNIYKSRQGESLINKHFDLTQMFPN